MKEIKKLLSEEQLNKVAGGIGFPTTYLLQCSICFNGWAILDPAEAEPIKEEHTAKTGHSKYVLVKES